MTPQEIFDRVCDHLAAQKCRAVNEDGACVYRGPAGVKCAVGALIPDELYDPAMEEGAGEGGPVENIALEIKRGRYSEQLSWIVEHQRLLSELQVLHDLRVHWSNPTLMEASLYRVANKFDLNHDKVKPTIIAIFG